MEDWKIKIAILWMVFEFGTFVVPIVEMYIPGFLESAITETTPELLVFLAIMTMISPFMAFLTLTLKDSTNRWANIVVAIIFAALTPMGVIEVPTSYAAPMVVIAIAQVVAAALIVWYAWKSKQKT